MNPTVRLWVVGSLVSCLSGSFASGQEPPAGTVAAEQGHARSEGFGEATSYREALANALEDAVQKAKGIAIHRGPALQHRVRIVAQGTDGDKAGWFNGTADAEYQWVLTQMSGFVRSYEVKKTDNQNGRWQVHVLAEVAQFDPDQELIVIDLFGARAPDLYRVETRDQNGAITTDQGKIKALTITEWLNETRRLKIKAAGKVALDGDSAPVEREKGGLQLCASHRVSIEWQPVEIRVDQHPNLAGLPPRKYLREKLAEARIRIVDLVTGTEQADITIRVAVPFAEQKKVEERVIEDEVGLLAEELRRQVREAVYCALHPPVVRAVRKLEGGFEVDVDVATRLLEGHELFAIGRVDEGVFLGRVPVNRGARGADPRLIVFRGVGSIPEDLEVGVSQVRPKRS